MGSRGYYLSLDRRNYPSWLGQMAGAALARSGWGHGDNSVAIPVPSQDNSPNNQALVPYPPNGTCYMTYSSSNDNERRMVPYQNFWNGANRNRGT